MSLSVGAGVCVCEFLCVSVIFCCLLRRATRKRRRFLVKEAEASATIALEQLQRSWRRRQRMCTTLNCPTTQPPIWRPLTHLTPTAKQSKPFTINYCWFLLRKPGSSNFSRIVFRLPPKTTQLPGHPMPTPLFWVESTVGWREVWCRCRRTTKR